MKNTARKKIKNKLDKAWSAKIRSIGRCELCGSTVNQLNAHHILMKKSLFMRYYIPNGISLCAYKCHAGGIHSPDFDVQKEFTKKIEDYVGEERLEDLREKKRTAPKLSTSDLQDILNKWLK